MARTYHARVLCHSSFVAPFGFTRGRVSVVSTLPRAHSTLSSPPTEDGHLTFPPHHAFRSRRPIRARRIVQLRPHAWDLLLDASWEPSRGWPCPANTSRIFARASSSCTSDSARVGRERAGAHLADAGALQRAMADVDVKEMAEVLYPRKQKVSLWIDLAKKRLEGCVANPAPRLRYWRRLREAPMDHSRRLT